MQTAEIDASVIELVSALAKLIEARRVPNDRDAARIRDMRTKLLHDLALLEPG